MKIMTWNLTPFTYPKLKKSQYKFNPFKMKKNMLGIQV